MALADAIAAAAKASPMPFTTNAEPVEGRVLHVDGDYCAYYCAGNDATDAGAARRTLLSRLDTAKRACGATKVMVHLSDARSTKGERFLIATTKPYQGQRNSGRKPDNWQHLREFMEGYEGDKFDKKLWLNREADDGMAYVCTASAALGRMHAVLTADKDMRMFPGYHVVWTTFQIVEVPYYAFDVIGGEGKQYGHKWFWLQMLMGDTADNIPGLPRVGEVAAGTALKGVTNNNDAYQIVKTMYAQKMGAGWARYFVEMAMLLWMRTDRHAAIYDFVKALDVKWDHEVLQEVGNMQALVKAGREKLEALNA